MEVPVGEEGFNMGWKGGISISAEMGLDIRIHRSWSWVTRLAKILLVETSEICWCLATSCKY